MKSGIKNLKGAKIGDQINLDGKKFFKDAHYIQRLAGLTEEDLKSTKNKFDFEVKGITRTVPAEVNQELFDKTFGKDSITDLEAFKEKVKESVAANYEREAEQFFYYKLRELVGEKTKITLPDGFLKKWLIETNENMTEELVNAEYDVYSKELKWSLISNRIAKDHDIKVEHEEVVQEAKNQIVQQFGGPAIIEQLGDQMDQFADNYLKAENGNNYMKVYNQVQSKKILEFVHETVSVKEKEVSLDEFRQLS